MEIYTLTDIGRVRKSNQDAVDGGIINDNVMWAVLCDGMGGANGGNVASEIAVQTVKENIGFFDPKASEYKSETFLTEIVEKANSTIYHKQRKDENLMGMGTTMELVIAVNGRAMIAHVGDSRTYLVQNNRIIQITVDHSMVQELVNRGEITAEQARVHPNKNYITRAVGVHPYIESDYIEIPFGQDDVIILCSDGLSNYISNECMLNSVQNYSGEELAQRLVDLANEYGGGDNISIAVLYANKNRE
ncbi:MAG: Stp1/IreP family PP2C-type Ser/Thr phosphatase [Acutalibacteraceae bacterium]|nr:Stp1/IreP family PP2C-type Ser/Thr phosphatase [Acutalibacteraceae bacterium]